MGRPQQDGTCHFGAYGSIGGSFSAWKPQDGVKIGGNEAGTLVWMVKLMDIRQLGPLITSGGQLQVS